LLLLISIIHVMLQVLNSTILLMLPMEELSMLLRMLLAQLIERQVEVDELISASLVERDLHLSSWLGLSRPRGSTGVS